MLCGFNPGFPRLFPCIGQIVHALLTRPPLIRSRRSFIARLACVRHAASVRPEPGSNSRLIFPCSSFRFRFFLLCSNLLGTFVAIFFSWKSCVLKGFLCCFIVKVRFFTTIFLTAVFCDSFNSLSYLKGICQLLIKIICISLSGNISLAPSFFLVNC